MTETSQIRRAMPLVAMVMAFPYSESFQLARGAGPATTTHDFAKVQRRRWLPTVAVQALQRLVHRQIIRPVMQGRRDGPPGPLVRLVAALPQLSYIPAYLIGVGLRPEHALTFARR
jgi:hypothetical protein